MLPKVKVLGFIEIPSEKRIPSSPPFGIYKDDVSEECFPPFGSSSMYFCPCCGNYTADCDGNCHSADCIMDISSPSQEFVVGFSSDDGITPIDIVSEITGLSYEEIRKCSKIILI